MNSSQVQALLWMLLLLPAFALSQVQTPDEDLGREWQALQQNEDRQTRAQWWRDIEPEQLSAFIRAGVDVNISDQRGWTSLHSAARYNTDPEIAAILLRAGASIDARNRSGDSPLHWAAAENTNADVVTALIKAGADVNARDRFGWSPLHTAAEGNANPAIIDTLLASGSKRNTRAYFLLFSPAFLLKHNDTMSATDKKIAMALLKEAR